MSLSLPLSLSRNNYYAVPLAEILPTGFPELDRLLPGGGWPAHCVTEIVAAPGYLDPLTLLLPALATLSAEPRWIACVAPPHLPVAEDLSEHDIDLSRILLVHQRPAQQALALAERAADSGNCAAVLAWVESLDASQLARLNEAARRHATTVFLFCPDSAERQASGAELRVFVATHSSRLEVEILHCRCQPGTSLRLPARAGRPLFTPRYYGRWPASCNALPAA
jgi:cell division inhibitor SulA